MGLQMPTVICPVSFSWLSLKRSRRQHPPLMFPPCRRLRQNAVLRNMVPSLLSCQPPYFLQNEAPARETSCRIPIPYSVQSSCMSAFLSERPVVPDLLRIGPNILSTPFPFPKREDASTFFPPSTMPPFRLSTCGCQPVSAVFP